VAYGMYHYIAEAWEKPYEGDHGKLMKERLIEWRNDPAVVRVEKPLRLNRARQIGYKAKQGFVVVRVRVRKGGQRKLRPRSGRRPKRMGVEGYTLAKSLQQVAEEKAQRTYLNLVVLGSYYLAEDGQHKWFEVIMVDPNAPTIKLDPQLKWVITSASAKGRPFRGLTEAGKRSRGLLSGRGLRGTHIHKWKKKAKERAKGLRHEASRGARLIVPHEKSEENK